MKYSNEIQRECQAALPPAARNLFEKRFLDFQKLFVKLIKSFCGGSRGHLRCGDKNVHGDNTSLEASYAIIALQMLPHAVGPGPPAKAFNILKNLYDHHGHVVMLGVSLGKAAHIRYHFFDNLFY
jgi:hypothetical protein